MCIRDRSDAQPYVPGMVEMMKEKGFAHMSEGALVVDVDVYKRQGMIRLSKLLSLRLLHLFLRQR